MSDAAPSSAELVKMADLARRSGVPAATIKHYLREGLLPQPPMRTSRNMAYYDAALVPRIKAIKELQRTRFLPLRVIREVLDGAEIPGPREEAETEAAIGRALSKLTPAEQRSRADLVASGVREAELDLFEQLGLVTAEGHGAEARYGGDDLALLQTLRDARAAGLRSRMLPPTILGPYMEAIRELVRLELSMFRDGVLPRAGGDLAALTEAATTLSERLVVLIRRKMLLPTLRQMVDEEAARRAAPRPKAATPRKREPAPAPPSPSRAGSAPKSSKRIQRTRGPK